MHQEFSKHGLVNFVLAITLLKSDYKYGGVIHFPNIHLKLNFEITSIIPISRILQEKKLPHKEILPYFVQIEVKKEGKKISLTKEETEFFFNFVFIYTIDAHFKIQEKISRKSALGPKIKFSTLRQVPPTIFVTVETYNLLIKKENLPFLLKQKTLL